MVINYGVVCNKRLDKIIGNFWDKNLNISLSIDFLQKYELLTLIENNNTHTLMYINTFIRNLLFWIELHIE